VNYANQVKCIYIKKKSALKAVYKLQISLFNSECLAFGGCWKYWWKKK